MLSEVTDSLSVSWGILLSIVVGILVSWLWPRLKSPGPWGVPLLGYYPFLREDFYVQLHELSKKYGEVYIINIAGQDFVYLSSLRAIREAHLNKAEYFPSRGHKHSVLQATLENGVAFLEGEDWRVHRKFFVQSMREIGISPNKAEMKGHMEKAILSTLDTLLKSEEKPINVTSLLNKECSSIVLKLVLGDAVTDDEEAKLSEAYLKMMAPMSGTNMLLVGNVAKYLIFPRIPGYSDMMDGVKDMTALLHKIVQDHKTNFDPNAEPKDFIDLYLREKHIREKKGDPQAKFFRDLALVSTLVQMYGDGSVGIGVFIASYLRAISLSPEIQNAIYEEILRVVGTERLPTWEDRSALPLTLSAIKEFLRTLIFLPVYADLECVSDTTVLGVRVPKGCITLVNTWAVHNDPDIYENPEQFDATRFLPDKQRIEQPVVFGIGKRACAGEGLVISEIFLFVSSVLQNFLLLPESDASSGIFQHEEAVNFQLRTVVRPESRFR